MLNGIPMVKSIEENYAISAGRSQLASLIFGALCTQRRFQALKIGLNLWEQDKS
jgi:hypothetical protein